MFAVVAILQGTIRAHEGSRNPGDDDVPPSCVAVNIDAISGRRAQAAPFRWCLSCSSALKRPSGARATYATTATRTHCGRKCAGSAFRSAAEPKVKAIRCARDPGRRWRAQQEPAADA
ncbi:hypothetical protein MRX96_019209 [Rhipicephalus microplus]